MNGILPLARQLGDYFEFAKPIEQPVRVTTQARRLNPGCWSPEAWAEIERIWNAPDATVDPGVWPLNEEMK